MIQRLEDHRFLAVIGASGCGKSSLVRAGLLPALDTGELFEAGDQWQTVIMRPGRSPFRNLAAAWRESVGRNASSSPDEDEPNVHSPQSDVLFTEAVLHGGPLGFLEAIEDARVDSETNVLLLVDQFEELFRFRYQDQGEDDDERKARAARSRDEANAFVNLLLATARQTRRQNVYVVLTMRSDFLGDCDAFHGLPAAINDSQFLTPRMTSQQIRQAILGPLQAFRADAERELVGRVLRDIGSERDELPLLQHALMRVWTSASSPRTPLVKSRLRDRDARPQPPEVKLRLAAYEQIGGLAHALSNHADEAFQELDSPEKQRIAEMMFRCLCDQGAEQRLTRRLVTVGEVAAVAGVTPEQVPEVSEVFRTANRCFLMPAEANKPVAEQTLDISHEALIRQWDRLGEWVAAEEQSAAIYRRLAETAEQNRAGTSGLYRPPELDIALAWREEEKPTEAWAGRYHENLRRSLEFLDESEEARQNRNGLAVMAFVLVASLAIFSGWQWHRARGLAKEAVRKQRQAETARADALDKKNVADAATVEATKAKEKARTAERETNRKLGFAKSLLSRIAWDQEHDAIKSTLYLYLAAQDYAKADDALETGMYFRALERSRLGPEKSFPSNGPVRGAELFSDGSRLLTWSDDGTARVWDVEQGQELMKFKHESRVSGAELFSDGVRLLTCSLDGTMRVWDVEQGQELKQFKHESRVFGAELFSDGARLLTWSLDGTARVWDVEQGQETKQFKHESRVFGAKLFSDGTRLLTWSFDGTARVWDAEQGQELKQFNHEVKNRFGESSPVLGAELFSDGTRLLTWGNDGTARLWDVDTSVALERRILEWEVKTATKIDEESGEFRVLNYDKWETLRQELLRRLLAEEVKKR